MTAAKRAALLRLKRCSTDLFQTAEKGLELVLWQPRALLYGALPKPRQREEILLRARKVGVLEGIISAGTYSKVVRTLLTP